MTKDFRNVGRISTDNAPPPAGRPPAMPAAGQRIVLGAIRAAAFALLVAGLWLLGGGTSPFPAETTFYLGIAFVVGAIADFGAIAVLKRVWSKPR